jgi:hypothetical protein
MSGILMGNLLSVGIITQALSPAIVAANTTAEQTFTVPGLKLGDFVSVIKPTLQAGLGIVNARVSAANTLAITFGNWSAGGLTPTAAESYLISYMRPESVQAGVVA